jgi:hypothetical protein
MSEQTGLELAYRRLLTWYPPWFRSQQGEEMLAVLMAGARPGQRRPGLMESIDVLRSALGMRLRSLPSGLRNQEWADALAVFSVAAPLFLLAADALEVLLPYHLVPSRFPHSLYWFGSRTSELGGLSLLREPFVIAVGCQAVIAALILLGLRWAALAAIAGGGAYLAQTSQWIAGIPRPLQLLTAGAYLLTAAALLISPGPRRGRQLLTWGHGVVLLLAAAAVQASTLRYYASVPISGILSPRPPGMLIYVVVTAVLVAAALIATLAARLSRYILLLLAAMVYPYVVQVAFPANSTSGDLLGHPTPSHLTLLFLPPVLVAVLIVITAVVRGPARLPSGPKQPGVA